MSLTPELITNQWQAYLPFLYKFYYEKIDLNFIEVIGAKFYKEPSQQDPLVLTFVVAGLETVKHINNQYQYEITQRLIRVFDLVLPMPIESEEIQTSKTSEVPKILTQTKQPELHQKNKIYYDKDITCFEDFIITQKRSVEFETSVTFYAVALKNDSIRILNASNLASRAIPKRISFLSQRSPFLAKNTNFSKLVTGNAYEAAVIPFQKEVNILRFNPYDLLLLCGCTDGTVIMINLNYQILSTGDTILNAFRIFTHHKRPVKDLCWMTYSYDEKHSFVSIADDGFLVWNKQAPTLPVCEITEVTRTPTSLIQVQPDQFIVSGRDCSLKFFDIKKGYSYTYNQNTEIITKLFNLTGQIEYSTKSKKQNIDNSLRFIGCEHTGKVGFWMNEKEFEHDCHQSKIAAVDFMAENGGLYLTIEKENPKLSIFSPILLTYCLQESD